MSNNNILPFIFILLFTFSFSSSPFNEMSEDSLKEFIEDSETCLDVDKVEDCISTSSKLKKKGDVTSECCLLKNEDNESWCANLSNNPQVKNYLLYFNSYGGTIDYQCAADSELETFYPQYNKEYERVNDEITYGLNATDKKECFDLVDEFKYADGCCYVDEKCGCFSEGVTKNEMDILLMLMETEFKEEGKTVDKVKGETFYCKDSSGEKSGTYDELFGKSENGAIMKFSGIFGLLLVIINLIL